MGEYYFRIPTYEELSMPQKKAIEDDNAIALSGSPGTGKSVVSIYRHIINHSKPNRVNSQLLTFTTSLALYLKKCVSSGNPDASQFVDSAIRWRHNNCKNRDEIIIDEAQDLPIYFHKDLTNYCNHFSYGADDQQLLSANSINPNGTYNLYKCSPESELRLLFKSNSQHRLTKNYRNSKRILKLSKSAFPQASIPIELIERCSTEGLYPRLLVYGPDLKKQDDAIISIIKQYSANADINTAILLPFEKPNSIAGDIGTVKYYYNLLKMEAPSLDFSTYTNSMSGCKEIKNIHLTTFKSVKGLEFDNVIIPAFHFYNYNFKVITWRDYFVGVTRARANLFLLSGTDLNYLSHEGHNKIVERVLL